MRNRYFNSDETNASNRIRREVGNSARFVLLSQTKKYTKRARRTKKGAKDLLLENAARKEPFLSHEQVTSLECFAGVQPGYAEREMSKQRNHEERNKYQQRPNETYEDHVARLRRMLVKGE